MTKDSTMTRLTRAVFVTTATAIMIPMQAHASIERPNLLPTPPMGFNNWARFMCNLNETLMVETADAMVANGLLDAGYNRINLDDCWMTDNRADNGSLQWNTTLFPHGIPWLGQYVHDQGFHLGIYEDSGTLTCGGYPGSLGHEELDVSTFASWGIDYLKLDGCNVSPQDGRTSQEEYRHLYGLWHQVLSRMESPLIFSQSAPAYFADPTNLTDWYTVMGWVLQYGELARHSTDILVYAGAGSAWDSIMNNYHFNTLLARYQRPGYFNDPDFLIPDHPGLTLTERKSHFALWASFSAPLIISAYIPSLPQEDIEYLTNRALIAVDQDHLAQQATLASRDNGVDVLTRSLANGDRLATVLNQRNSTTAVSIPIARLGLDPQCTYPLHNLWDGSTQHVQGSLTVELEAHATAVYRLTLPRECTVTPTGIVFNTQSGNCLTATDDGSVHFQACRGADSEIWRVSTSGTLQPLSQQASCLATDGKVVFLQTCSGKENQQWSYAITGTVKSVLAGQCLTEGAGVQPCGREKGSQVFGLPSGVEVRA